MILPVRDSPPLYRSRYSKIHWLKSAASQDRRKDRNHSKEHYGYTELLRTTHASSLLGERLARVRAVAVDNFRPTIERRRVWSQRDISC